MIMKEKVCLTTFVHGEKYQDFIPLFIYSVKKSYPDYSIKLFVSGSLKDGVRSQLSLLNIFDDFEVLENQFEDLNICSPLEARTVRWILPRENFLAYDYVYVVDIDIFYIIEPISLHKQHIMHMEYLGLPFSNIRRNYNAKANTLKLIYQRLRDTGPTAFLKFIRTGNLKAKQLTGLHFFKVEPYFEKMNDSIKELTEIISSKSYRTDMINNDEVFLYKMIEKSGIDMTKIGLMKNSVSMLDYNQPERLEFRPHHGIHLGIFRNRGSEKSLEPILRTKEYDYYIKVFEQFFDDPLFRDLLIHGSKTINKMIKRLTIYYDLDK